MSFKWTSALLLAGLVRAQHGGPDSSVIAAFAGEGVSAANVPQDAAGEETGLYQSPPLNSHKLDRSGWTLTCDSENVGYECIKIIDADNTTFWHSESGPAENATLPHSVIIDLKSTQNVSGVSVLPRQDGSFDGRIATHQVFLSSDGTNWGDAVAYGTWWPDANIKLSVFEPKPAQYLRLLAITEVNGTELTSIADLNVWAADYSTVPDGDTTTGDLGAWGPTIDFPVVPVSAAVEPNTGKVLVWSSWRQNQYGGTQGGYTQFAIWDPSTGDVSHREVRNTHHDMFCPGISMDERGRIIVTGGNDASRTSIYDPFTDAWTMGAPMKTRRGYQATTALSDGRIFAIGGSWSGGQSASKNGEVYDPEGNSWRLLPGARVGAMLTNDRLGPYHSDNHGWLFGWKNETIFQAGPSRAMNWYFVDGEGDQTAAGNRGDDYDQMSGSAVMYDAVHGKILTFGGSPDYENSDSTRNASIITIGAPNNTAVVAKAGNGLLHDRVFHTSVVLPDGSTFIAGGQQHSAPFIETTLQLVPERYMPGDNKFIEQHRNNIARVYHSWSLLLPDATVLNGGGGLCANCSANHYDAQIFTPPYLLNADGTRATRPAIRSASPSSVKYGGQVTIKTDSTVSNAALIRYGSTTHTVNTDQRRIELELAPSDDNTYTATIPNDPGIALPGYWMLFVLNDAGVPSVANTIQVTR